MKAPTLVTSLFAAALCAGCVSVGDGTTGRSSVCENHRVTMTPKRVRETYGMKRGYSPMDLARKAQFPHADEPYDTGACMGAYNYWKVYICPACSQARTDWLAAQPQPKP